MTAVPAAVVLTPAAAANGGLANVDLANVYSHVNKAMQENHSDKLVLPDNSARFKKKEPLESMAKSILKHRIQTLTGRSMATIEAEMGYTNPNPDCGGGLPVDALRVLAHFLILEASSALEHVRPSPQLPVVQPPTKDQTFGRKRGRNQPMAAEDEEVNQDAGKRARKDDGRNDEKTACKLGPSRKSQLADAPSTRVSRRRQGLEVPEDPEGADPGEELDLVLMGLGPNPTPHMIAQKRKSLLHLPVTRRTEVSRRRSEAPPVRPSTKVPMSRRNMQVKAMVADEPILLPPLVGYSGNAGNEIYLVEGNPLTLTFKRLASQIGRFSAPAGLVGRNSKSSGANLVVVHTPVAWGPPEVHSLVLKVRRLNREAGMETFTVLVGCGLDNLHLMTEALKRQTQHVQFVVFERQDQDEDLSGLDGEAGGGRDKTSFFLREVTSYFLVAYFFPGCDADRGRAVPPCKMVRPGTTTCFRTKNIEDLENSIVHCFSEEGDWILDLCCAGRELCLAAQKTGRNAIAVHGDGAKLLGLHEKASAIAGHHDPSFRPGIDGVILRLD